MNSRSAALACVGRGVGALALLLMASCASYEVREQPVGVALPQPVPRPTPAIGAAPLPPADSELSASGLSRREPGVHRARSGETAYSVARRYGVDAYAVITANNLFPLQPLRRTASRHSWYHRHCGNAARSAEQSAATGAERAARRRIQPIRRLR